MWTSELVIVLREKQFVCVRLIWNLYYELNQCRFTRTSLQKEGANSIMCGCVSPKKTRFLLLLVSLLISQVVVQCVCVCSHVSCCCSCCLACWTRWVQVGQKAWRRCMA